MKIPMPTLGMVRLRETNIGDIIVINPETKNDFWIVVWWNEVGDVRVTNIARTTTRVYHTTDPNDNILVYRLSYISKELI